MTRLDKLKKELKEHGIDLEGMNAELQRMYKDNLVLNREINDLTRANELAKRLAEVEQDQLQMNIDNLKLKLEEAIEAQVNLQNPASFNLYRNVQEQE